MKLKRLLSLLLALMLTTSLLAACAKSTADNMGLAQMSPAAPAMKNESLSMDSASSASGASDAVPTGQKLIRTVNINAETENLEALLGSLTGKIASLGGYVERQELYNGSSYASYRSRNANLTIRIPAERLDGFLSEVKGVSNVVSYNESQEDVTLTYVSTESRVKALETEQERLLELLSKANTMSDLLEIEARLTDVRYELERVTSQLLVLANQVDYATVYLYISQVTVYTEVEEQTVWQRIASGFRKNLKDLGEGLTNFFVWVATYSPQVILATVVLILVIRRVRRRNQKRREQLAKIFPPQEAPKENKSK